MRFELVKDVIFKSSETSAILAEMDDEIKEAFFLHFYHHPKAFTFTRLKDDAKIERNAEAFATLLPADANGAKRLIEFFLVWKEYFDRFEKKVLEILSEKPKASDYLFLRSQSFINNRESWEKKGIEESKEEIQQTYFDYNKRIWHADEALGKYYLIKDNYDHKILANKYTHQLYDLRKTFEVSGFASGEGYSLIPLLVKYEDVYETPINEHELWDKKFGVYLKERILKFSVLFLILGIKIRFIK